MNSPKPLPGNKLRTATLSLLRAIDRQNAGAEIPFLRTKFPFPTRRSLEQRQTSVHPRSYYTAGSTADLRVSRVAAAPRPAGECRNQSRYAARKTFFCPKVLEYGSPTRPDRAPKGVYPTRITGFVQARETGAGPVKNRPEPKSPLLQSYLLTIMSLRPAKVRPMNKNARPDRWKRVDGRDPGQGVLACAPLLLPWSVFSRPFAAFLRAYQPSYGRSMSMCGSGGGGGATTTKESGHRMRRVFDAKGHPGIAAVFDGDGLATLVGMFIQDGEPRPMKSQPSDPFYPPRAIRNQSGHHTYFACPLCAG